MTAPPPPPDLVAEDRYRCDVAIIGAGVAGLYAAARLPDDLQVVVVDKGTAGRSGSSPWAQGGMAAAFGPEDSPESHAQDTIRAGDGLCDPAAVDVLAYEAPGRVRDLMRMGARFDVVDGADPTDSTALHLAREGAQTHARSVHTADATGAELVRALRAHVAPQPWVRRLEGTALSLAKHEGVVSGVHVLETDGHVTTLEARSVLLATGGCGGLYAATTNQDHATGDGVALALHAGAAVRDLEFVQFHPTGMATEGPWRFLLTEALRGEGATLLDADGHRFMLDLHPDAELAPRHVVARGILAQEGGAFLDATGLGLQVLEEEFPTVLAGAREHGFDLATQRVPVTPAAHYMVGGVRTDLGGRTSIPGLYAAGEVASTGLHGANRMAGNSLVEALVFGRRAARAIRVDAREQVMTDPPPKLLPADDRDDLADLRGDLREAMWVDAGPARSAGSLRRVLARLDTIEERIGPATTQIDVLELRSAVTVGRAIALNALLRTETRGGHVRDDHPVTDRTWDGVHIERTAPVPPGLGG